MHHFNTDQIPDHRIAFIGTNYIHGGPWLSPDNHINPSLLRTEDAIENSPREFCPSHQICLKYSSKFGTMKFILSLLLASLVAAVPTPQGRPNMENEFTHINGQDEVPISTLCTVISLSSQTDSSSLANMKTHRILKSCFRKKTTSSFCTPNAPSANEHRSRSFT